MKLVPRVPYARRRGGQVPTTCRRGERNDDVQPAPLGFASGPIRRGGIPVSDVFHEAGVAELSKRVAHGQSLPIPDDFRFLSFVQGKYGVDIGGNNVRAAIDLLPDTLRRFKVSVAIVR